MTELSTHQHGGLNRGRHVSIVGGGIGGLTCALAFARSGARVDVHEQAPEIGEVGAGIQITPNGARVFEALGLDGAAVEAASIKSKAVLPMDGLTGRQITRFDLTSLDGPAYRFYHRASLIGLLLDACRDAGVVIHLGSKITVDEVDGDLVVGAEGIHSQTRALLNGLQEPFFTGQVAWRAMVDAPDADAVARIWMAPNRHVVTYPLKGGLLNIVAVLERQQWAPEGWAHPDDAGNLRHVFRDGAPELKGILSKVDEVHLWGLFRHPVAEQWHNDTVAILGDAAHPTLPFLAQGANMAIEDAFVLSRCCDEAADIASALATYQADRKPRVSRAIDAANANARNYHLSGIRRGLSHTALKIIGKTAPNAFLNRMDWLYGCDVTTDRR
ncbi:FAD-dependent monooxygenase [Octadecabacter sp. 1_MG-2023]|uniref:FAD-dependent monooxygenase n=1 Tax=unclassified Octadecabacter TaxID=196158 RepID=UPI001C0A20E1|nr:MULTISPECIES: FAD-dependent monooxygenase [unclassified Octadecabacter]MBU2993629.1 FAD-dependent monooxygenase [Octadecabacter sp. B2R22]MDO6735527.1 FAD-dependent monooxygenase [Octadecabacter sp. 1_MG-2023]